MCKYRRTDVTSVKIFLAAVFTDHGTVPHGPDLEILSVEMFKDDTR
jgi:hypothetical protein